MLSIGSSIDSFDTSDAKRLYLCASWLVMKQAGKELHTGHTSRDATNAFASTTTTAHARTIDHHAAPSEHPLRDLFLQKQRNACVDVHTADGVLQVRPTVEKPMGDRFVPSAFALTYRRPVTRRMLGNQPWIEDVPSVFDMSTVAFADGIRVVHQVEISVFSTPAPEAVRLFSIAVTEAHLLSRELKVEEGVHAESGKG